MPELATRRRISFGKALASALSIRSMTQKALGDALGLSQSSISSWMAGEATPEPDTIFAAEKALSLPPGQLARHFGFVPVEAVHVSSSVEDAILADEGLSDQTKRAFIAMYHAALTPDVGSRPGRPRVRGRTG